MGQTLYVPPHKNWALFSTVTAAGVDPDYSKEWLVDGRPGFPCRFTTGAATILLAKAAAQVNLVAVCHHLLDAALSIAISGDLSGAVVIPAYPPNGVPMNAYKEFTPAAVNDLTLTMSGNSSGVLIGEIIAGEALILDPSLRIEGSSFGHRRYVDESDVALSGIPPYSDGARARLLQGSQVYSAAQYQLILDWFDAQDAYAYPVPSLLIPDSDDPSDARLVTLLPPTASQVQADPDRYLVELSFTEYPRTRW